MRSTAAVAIGLGGALVVGAGLASAQTTAGASQPASGPQAPAQAGAAQPSTIPDSVKTRQTLSDDSEAAARLDNEPFDPTLKGFFLIPGTNTRLKIGGYARLDVIHDFEPIGNTSEFIVSSIPIDVVSGDDNTRLQARQTRFNFELRREAEARKDVLRVFFEFDFFGSSETSLNLRHAFGQMHNVLGGYTASTIQDPDAKPDTLDHEGPSSRIDVRHAQLRYTFALPSRQSLALAVEDPKSDVPASSQGQPVTPRTPWPDMVVRYRLDARRGHVQAGVIVRSMGGFLADGEQSAQVFGGGGAVSGSLLVWRKDTLVFEFSTGHGLARYIKDMAGLGLDLAVDAQGVVRATEATGGYFSYQHVWHDRWRSTIVVSHDHLQHLEVQSPDAYRTSRYAAANLLYRPASNFTIGVECSTGRYEVQDGRNDRATRLQLGVQYDLIK